MKEIFSFLFERLTDPLSLPINPLWEYLILLVIGSIAYTIAFSLVGEMYRSGNISGGCLGSLFHWLIRLFVFVVVWAIAYGVITSIQWLTAHWMTIISILGMLAISASVIAIIVIFHRRGGAK